MKIQQVTMDSTVPEVASAIVRTIQQEGHVEIQATDNRAVYQMLNGIARARRKLASESVDLSIAPVLARVDRDGRRINAVRLSIEGHSGGPSATGSGANSISTADIIDEFAERQEMSADYDHLLEELLQHTSESPLLSGGDVDAAWQESDVGQETVGGSVSTPDQDIVELLGQAVGLTYEDDEPLRTTEKLEARDEDRWMLDPRSARTELDRENE